MSTFVFGLVYKRTNVPVRSTQTTITRDASSSESFYEPYSANRVTNLIFVDVGQIIIVVLRSKRYMEITRKLTNKIA